jgi:hypothetical protein
MLMRVRRLRTHRNERPQKRRREHRSARALLHRFRPRRRDRKPKRRYPRKVVIAAALPVAAVAVIAGVVSYSHILALGLRAYQGQTNAHLLPFAVDGLIVSGSVILLAGSWLGWIMVTPGVAATLFANLESGLPHGKLAGVVSTWPAIAFTIASFVLERWLKKQTGRHDEDDTAPVPLIQLPPVEADWWGDRWCDIVTVLTAPVQPASGDNQGDTDTDNQGDNEGGTEAPEPPPNQPPDNDTIDDSQTTGPRPPNPPDNDPGGDTETASDGDTEPPETQPVNGTNGDSDGKPTPSRRRQRKPSAQARVTAIIGRHPELTNAVVAKRAGVSERTVQRARKEPQGAGTIG